MKKKLWMFVTKDEYELPLMVCDSVDELAKRLGKRPNTIYSAISKAKLKNRPCMYHVVEIEEDPPA